MANQTTYSERHSAAFVGQIGTQIPNTLISRTVEEAAGLAFGTVAVQGTGDAHAINPNLNGENKVLGIVAREESAQLLVAANTDRFVEGSEARIITKGHVYVTVGENVVAGDRAYFVEATGVIQKTSGANITALNGVFDTTALSGALALLRLL